MEPVKSVTPGAKLLSATNTVDEPDEIVRPGFGTA